MHVVQTGPDSVTLRWRVTSDGNSPVVKAVINYKMTHGEWLSAEVSCPDGARGYIPHPILQHKILSRYIKLVYMFLHHR